MRAHTRVRPCERVKVERGYWVGRVDWGWNPSTACGGPPPFDKGGFGEKLWEYSPALYE